MADVKPKGRRRGKAAGKPEGLPLDQVAEAAAAKAAEEKAGAGPEAPRDTPPGSPAAGEPDAPRKPRKPRVSKAETQQIEKALAEMLQAPGIPADMLGDVWLAEHFRVQGEAFAARIAAVSERNPVLRSWAKRLLEGESVAVLLFSALMYAGPPLMHFGLVPGGQVIGVPVMGKAQRPQSPSEATVAHEPEHHEPPAPSGRFAEGDIPVRPPSPGAEPVAPAAHFAGEGDGAPPTFTEPGVPL